MRRAVSELRRATNRMGRAPQQGQLCTRLEVYVPAAPAAIRVPPSPFPAAVLPSLLWGRPLARSDGSSTGLVRAPAAAAPWRRCLHSTAATHENADETCVEDGPAGDAGAPPRGAVSYTPSDVWRVNHPRHEIKRELLQARTPKVF